MRRLFVLALAAAACAPPARETPQDVDGLARWLWVNGDTADDAALVEAAGNVHAAVGGDDLDPPDRGTLEDLTSEELAVVDLADRDPAPAQGLFYAGVVRCDAAQLADILSAPNQDELFPGVYDSYARDFDGDRDAFVAGDADRLSWTTTYGATLVSSPYTASSRGSLRRAQVDGADRSPALVARTYMPEPATFEDEANEFALDFQIETYHPRDDGASVHFYAIWRELHVGDFSTDDDVVLGFIFDALVRFDERTSELCAAP